MNVSRLPRTVANELPKPTAKNGLSVGKKIFGKG